MFWAEAVATEVRSVVTVMPVTRKPLTPRLKRVWRRINKAKVPRLARRRSPGAPSLNDFGDRRKYDLRVPRERRLEPIADDVPTSLFCRSHVTQRPQQLVFFNAWNSLSQPHAALGLFLQQLLGLLRHAIAEGRPALRQSPQVGTCA